MIDETTQLLTMLNKKSSVTPLVGSFVSVNLGGCVVDVGGGRIPAKFGSAYLPEINESVLVWFIDGTPYVMGPTTTKPGRGTVVSVSAGLVTLTTSIGPVTVPYAATVSPAAGQVMALMWQEGGFAVAVLSTSPPAGIAPPAANAGSAVHVDVFTAIDAGSRQSSGWWTPKVYASDTNLSAWFYGTKIQDSLPAGTSVSNVEIYISAQQISGSAPIFALHPHQIRPAGAPSLSSSTAIAVRPGWVGLPVAFGNALKSGGGSAGVGINHGGYSIFNSLTTDGQSGALRISSTY